MKDGGTTLVQVPSIDRCNRRRILLVALVSWLGLMPMGVALSVLPARLVDHLGFGTILVGIVMGLEPVATLISRKLAGDVSDRRGPKRAMMLGLGAAAASSAVSLLSAGPSLDPISALALLAVGRILLGLGESFVFVGSGTWPIGLVGRERAGTLLSWIGIALFGGIAAGTALGTAVYATFGFVAAMMASGAVASAGFVVAAVVAPAKPSEREAVGIWRVARQIWRPGLVFFLSTVGYAAIASFLVLLFSSRGWSGGGYALTLFGAGFVGARFILGDRADRADGPRLAILSLGVEMAGLVMIGLAPNPSVAFAGAAICGLGVSPIYPLLAVQAIRSGPPDQLGVTIAAYDSCFDLALMLASPAFGILAEAVGLPGIFLLAAIPPAFAMLAAMHAYPRAGVIDKRGRDERM